MTLGLLVDGRDHPLERIDEAIDLGFEAISLTFWEETDGIDWGALAAGVVARGLPISALSVYGNPLAGDAKADRVARGWETLIRQAGRFGAPVVSGFAGRVPGEPVAQSLEPWKRWYAPLADLASAQGVTLAFETCRMGGTWKTGNWNIAYTPRAWELMESALPGAWSLEWEPGHAVLALADPLTQIDGWVHRVVHLHGKDAAMHRPVLARDGMFGGGEPGRYCLPGEGDSDWPAIVAAFQASEFFGSLDIEVPSPSRGEQPKGTEEVRRSLAYLRPMVSRRR